MKTFAAGKGKGRQLRRFSLNAIDWVGKLLLFFPFQTSVSLPDPYLHVKCIYFVPSLSFCRYRPHSFDLFAMLSTQQMMFQEFFLSEWIFPSLVFLDVFCSITYSAHGTVSQSPRWSLMRFIWSHIWCPFLLGTWKDQNTRSWKEYAWNCLCLAKGLLPTIHILVIIDYLALLGWILCRLGNTVTPKTTRIRVVFAATGHRNSYRGQNGRGQMGKDGLFE